tara:strand:- start:1771 stop:1953 length:183 start_codon:yes stop_codon:yes gene_type:complete
MIDKEYLDKIKKEDYTAWDDILNDPTVIGSGGGGGGYIIFIMILLSSVAAFVFGVLQINK